MFNAWYDKTDIKCTSLYEINIPLKYKHEKLRQKIRLSQKEKSINAGNKPNTHDKENPNRQIPWKRAITISAFSIEEELFQNLAVELRENAIFEKIKT